MGPPGHLLGHFDGGCCEASAIGKPGLSFALLERIAQIWPMRLGNTSIGGGTPGRVRF